MTKTLLSSAEEVRRIAGFNKLDDISDNEVNTYVEDATDEIYDEYGNPVRVTYTTINSTTGSTLYDFTGNNQPVYEIQRITIDGNRNNIVPTGSYTEELDEGFVDFDFSFLENYNTHDLKYEWVPKIYNLLAKNIAAFELLSNYTVMSGESSESARLRRLGNRVNMYKNKLAPTEVVHTGMNIDTDERTQGYDYIYQKHWYDFY